MKLARIRQIEKLDRALQADGYEVRTFVNIVQKRLVIHIKIAPDEGEEIMAKWNDLKKVEGG